MNCIIIDDDPLSRELLKGYIDKTSELNFIEEFESPISAVEFLKNNKVDLAFLDVEMPGMTGIEMLQHFELPQVVLISTKKEYASDAFNYDVTDFINKPIAYARFLKSIEKVNKVNEAFLNNKENEDPGVFYIKDSTRYIRLDVNLIIYIEALGDYVKIHTQDDRYTVLSTMKNIEAKLKPYSLIRIHRSHIINTRYIKEFEDNSLNVDGKLFTVSKAYRKNFFEHMKEL